MAERTRGRVRQVALSGFMRDLALRFAAIGILAVLLAAVAAVAIASSILD